MNTLPEIIANIPASVDKKHDQFWKEIGNIESVIMNEAYDNRNFVSDNSVEIIIHAKNAAAKLLVLARNLALGMDLDSPTVKRDLVKAGEGAGAFADVVLAYWGHEQVART